MICSCMRWKKAILSVLDFGKNNTVIRMCQFSFHVETLRFSHCNKESGGTDFSNLVLHVVLLLLLLL